MCVWGGGETETAALKMRNRRVHPESGADRDPESGSGAFFTDVKEAWSVESTPERERSGGSSRAAGGGLVPLLPIDQVPSYESIGGPGEESKLVPSLPERKTALVPSPRSAGSTGFGSTPRLSDRKHHKDEDADDDDHSAPSCGSYYAPRNRYDHSRRPCPPPRNRFAQKQYAISPPQTPSTAVEARRQRCPAHLPDRAWLCRALTVGRVPLVDWLCPGITSRSSTRRSCSCCYTSVKYSR